MSGEVTSATGVGNQSGYTQGYAPSVLASHASRTATADAAFLLPHLRPGMHVLDVGCGPGTITTGFSPYVGASGSVMGIDIGEAAIEAAREHAAQQGVENVSFVVGDMTKGVDQLADGTFDVVYCNQVISQLPEPVTILREMKRLAKPDGKGIVACREGAAVDLFWWYPSTSGLVLWNQMLERVLRSAGADPQGRKVPAWAREAGFDPAKMKKRGSMVVYGSESERNWWANLHIERVRKSAWRENALNAGMEENDLEEMVKALEVWREDVDG